MAFKRMRSLWSDDGGEKNREEDTYDKRFGIIQRKEMPGKSKKSGQ